MYTVRSACLELIRALTSLAYQNSTNLEFSRAFVTRRRVELNELITKHGEEPIPPTDFEKNGN